MPFVPCNFKLFAKDAGRLLIAPGYFFSQEEYATCRKAAALLTIAAIASAGLFQIFVASKAPFFSTVLFLFNFMGTLLISAIFGFIVLRIAMRRSFSFGRLFRLFACAGSWPLVLACIPGTFLLTETWKWSLIGIGLTHSAGLTRWQAFIVVVGSLGLTTIFLSCLILLSQ